jgi:2-O-methyltransferase
VKIHDWVERRFRGSEPKLILELGAHIGQDTAWMGNLPNTRVHAVEADPRNERRLRTRARRNVTVYAPLAIAGHDGVVELTQSMELYGKSYTKSSSIHTPTGHLHLNPGVTFGSKVTVPCVTLDSFAEREAISFADLIWADLQGAEPDMIRGGQKTLARTRYLFAEVPPHEEYEGQLPLEKIMELLPEWTIEMRWPNDVLLRNLAWE